MRRIEGLKLDLGIFPYIVDLLAFKAQSMGKLGRYCIIFAYEFLIASQLDHDKSLGKFIGSVTLGNSTTELGEKRLVVVIRGVENNWKPILVCHVTQKTTIDPEILIEFILSCISAVEACGLVILALSSDFDRRNSFYSSVEIAATREGIRQSRILVKCVRYHQRTQARMFQFHYRMCFLLRIIQRNK